MDSAGWDSSAEGLARLRSRLRQLPQCRECIRSWRELTGGNATRDGERRTLIACSGGADSTALLLCLWAAAPRAVVVGHIVHDMRPHESAEGDARAVAELCASLAVPFRRESIRANDPRRNVEATARERRYAALARLAQESGCWNVATAHHADDQLETILMRLLRGSGTRGMGGIAPSRRLTSPSESPHEGEVHLVRPMLGLSRGDTEDVCRLAKVQWRHDATNDDPFRWRARLRLEVVPLLKQMRPGLEHRAEALAGAMRGTDRMIRREASVLLAKGVYRDGGLEWPRASVENLDNAALWELLRQARESIVPSHGGDAMGATLTEMIAKALRHPDRRERRWDAGWLRVTLDTNHLRIAPCK